MANPLWERLLGRTGPRVSMHPDLVREAAWSEAADGARHPDARAALLRQDGPVEPEPVEGSALDALAADAAKRRKLKEDFLSSPGEHLVPSMRGAFAQALRRHPEGLAEGAMTAGTGLIAQPVGGLTGLLTGLFGGSLEDMGTEQEKMQSALTYTPRGEAGLDVLTGLGQDMERSGVFQLPRKAGEAVADALGNSKAAAPWARAVAPFVGAGITTLGELVQPGGEEKALLEPAVAKAAKEASTGLKGTPTRMVSEALRVKKGGPIGTVPWDEMGLEQAMRVAHSNVHLKPKAGGGFVGAPEWVKTQGDLQKLRNQLDAAVAKGAYGGDWYDRAREAIRGIAMNDPRKEEFLGFLHGVFSANAPVDSNMGFAIRQANALALDPNTKVQPGRGAYSKKALRKFHGEQDIDLGNKIGPFTDKVTPNLGGEASKVRGVNDLWMGRAYGYEPNAGQSAFDRGFTDAEHSFLTGENLRAAARAKAKGLLPEGVDPSVESVQAAIWVAERWDDLMQEARGLKPRVDPETGAVKPPKVTKATEALSAAEKRVKRGTASPEDQALVDRTLAETKDFANVTYGDYLDKYTAHEPYGVAPSKAANHLPLAEEQWPRSEYARTRAWAQEGEPDPFYAAAHPMAAGATREAVSLAGDNGFVARPMVSFLGSKMDDKKTEVSSALRGKRLNAPDEELLNGISYLRAALGGQESARWQAANPSTSNRNSALLRYGSPLSPEARAKLLDNEVLFPGLEFTDLGGGDFRLHGKGGQLNWEDMDATTFGKLLRESGLEKDMAPVGRGHLIHNEVDLPWDKPGQVTEGILSRVRPYLGEQLDKSADIRNKLRRNIALDDEMSREGFGPVNAGLQKLRAIVAEHGVEGLRKMVREAGGAEKLGLPAVLVGAYLAGQEE